MTERNTESAYYGRPDPNTGKARGFNNLACKYGFHERRHPSMGFRQFEAELLGYSDRNRARGMSESAQEREKIHGFPTIHLNRAIELMVLDNDDRCFFIGNKLKSPTLAIENETLVIDLSNHVQPASAAKRCNEILSALKSNIRISANRGKAKITFGTGQAFEYLAPRRIALKQRFGVSIKDDLGRECSRVYGAPEFAKFQALKFFTRGITGDERFQREEYNRRQQEAARAALSHSDVDDLV